MAGGLLTAPNLDSLWQNAKVRRVTCGAFRPGGIVKATRTVATHLATFIALFLVLPEGQTVQAQTKITIARWGLIGTNAAYVLASAQEHGFFAKRGLDVTVIVGPPKLVGTQAQIGVYGAPAVLQENSRGNELKILAAIDTGRISGQLVTRPEINGPDELRGKRFGTTAIGAGNWISLMLALRHFGLDPKRDNIDIQVAGSSATDLAKALADGKIDAAWLPSALGIQMKSKGFSTLLDAINLNSYGVHVVLTTTGPYLQQHRDVIENVVAAMVEAMAFGLAPENKQAILKAIMQEFGLTDPAAAETGYRTLSDLNRKLYPSLEKLRNLQTIMTLDDPQVLKVNAETLIQDGVVRSLDESGVIDRIYASYGIR